MSFHFSSFPNTEMTKIKLLINSEAAVENMTEEERDFHYFTVHDYDKNNFLDGLEVALSSISATIVWILSSFYNL